MTFASDERREIAANLRRIPREYLADDFFFRKAVYDAIGLKIKRDAKWPTLELVEQNDRNLANRIADLIDPTCEMEPQGECFRCSACGTHHDMSGFEEFPWPRCPECGARVVSGGSA